MIKVDAGSILDASLANEVVDSAELNDGVDEISVVPSSSVDVLFPLTDPSSPATSESNADCLVKLYSKEKMMMKIEFYLPVVLLVAHYFLHRVVLAFLNIQHLLMVVKSVAFVRLLSLDFLQLDQDLVHDVNYSSIQMLHPNHRVYTNEKEIFFERNFHQLSTNKTFQRSNNNFRIGNGGDGALQKTQIA
jgi:hypothetical protein